MVVTERDASKQITLETGDTLTVRLRAQLGTGYGWQIAEHDPSLLKPSGPPETEAPGADRPGAAEYQIFRFRAQMPGTTRLVLRYARPWEKNEAPQRTFEVRVTIR